MCFQDRSSSMTTTRDEIAKNHDIQDICPPRPSPDICPCRGLDLILITTSVHQPGACLSSQLPPCLFFQALAFLIPYIHLDAEDISSPCPNETTAFYKNVFANRCLFQYTYFYHSSSLYCIFYFSLCFFSSLHCVFFLFVICVKGADVTFIC